MTEVQRSSDDKMEWRLIVPVPDDMPAPGRDLINEIAPAGMVYNWGGSLERTEDGRSVPLGYVVHYATLNSMAEVKKATLYLALFEADDGRRGWRKTSEDDINEAAEAVGIIEQFRLPACYDTPPPWREDDDPSKRDAIAAFCTFAANREAFLKDVKAVAWYFSMDVARAAALGVGTGRRPSKERERAAIELNKLSQALKGLNEAVTALGPLAISKLDAVVDDAVDYDWMANLLPQAILRDRDRPRGGPAIAEIGRSAVHAAALSQRAIEAIEPSIKGRDEARHDCIQRLGRALWRHNGERPTPDNRRHDFTEKRDDSPLHALSLLVMNYVLEFHGQRTEGSFAGYVKRAEDALRGEEYPADDVFGPIG